MLSTLAHAQYPDGTLVFSSKRGLVGRIAKRITGGDQYTHVGIVFGGRVYESDFPRATSTPVSQYGKRGTTNDYYVPTRPIGDINAMHATAQSMLGTRYGLRGYIKPVRKPDMWCSPYVGKVLNAGGQRLTASDYHEPQNLLNRMSGSLQFGGRVVR
jgi:hypothetical protein